MRGARRGARGVDKRLSTPKVEVLSGVERRERFVTPVCRGESLACSSCVFIDMYMSTPRVEVLSGVGKQRLSVTPVCHGESSACSSCVCVCVYIYIYMHEHA